jgi:hypothetical protein
MFRASRILRVMKTCTDMLLRLSIPVVALSFICLTAPAQEDFIILTKGDTLYGKVQHLTYGVEQQVQYTGSDKKKTVYKIFQVKGFRIKGEDYQAVKFFDTYKYMKQVVYGYTSVYLYQEEGKTTWDGRYLYRMDGTGLDVPNIGFKRKVAEYLEDCPQVVDEINAGKVGRTDLAKIIQQYNDCIEQNTLVSKSEITPESVGESKLAKAWDELRLAVEHESGLEDKTTDLEMISEAIAKVQQNEKVPNFIINGLKKSFKDFTALQELLTKATESGNE